jgi:hypothetical protein
MVTLCVACCKWFFFRPGAVDAEAVVIEEVILTARKREASSQNIPVAMTALTAVLDSASH